MISEAIHPVDLDAYLERIGYAGPRRPTLDVLKGLHLAHATHIPFENLDILLGRPIRLDLESLQAKLVRARRGGYCFEHNTLFAAALESLGFAVTRLAARVRLGTTRVGPRTHMLLTVAVDGALWVADVGFGGGGLLEPLPLAPGEARQYGWAYRLVEESGSWVLQVFQAGTWLDLYAFTLEPHLPVDFEVANYFTATHPDSYFRRTLTAQLPTPEARFTLRSGELTVERGEQVSRRAVADDELLSVLSESFGLDFPPGTRFPLAGAGLEETVKER
jgi:N-hydroxyarylamine O-acetyltransferase